MGTTGNLNIKDVLNGTAAKKINQYDQGFEVDDDWGDDWGEEDEKEKDYSKFDYQNTNLNKLNDKDLAAHKKNMDKGFSKNQLKPGDAGFEYDKRVDFTNLQNDEDEDDSWDSNTEKQNEFRDPMDEEEEDMDYFDDDFS